MDIETTGFLNQGGKIVEIGIVELNLLTGQITPAYNSLIREQGLTRLHTQGILGWIFKNSDLKYEDVECAPSLEEQRKNIQLLFDQYHATAFNKAFDFDFLRDRGFRINDLDCPMLIATPICKLPHYNGRSGYKWPKVEEAWDHFFGNTGYIEAHRGLDDAEHEAQIVYELYKQGQFKVPFEVKPIQNVKSYFSTVDNIQEVLLEQLDTATQKIMVAVAWFTDRTLFNKLLEKQRSGVEVKLIVAKDDINDRFGVDFARLSQIGGEVSLMYNDEGVMHNKFCVVDYNIVCMGSYNWTKSAKDRNQESLSVHIGFSQMANDFDAEFERLREMCGKEKELKTTDLSEIIQILNAIKAFISLNEANQIAAYTHRLQGVIEVEYIHTALNNQQYPQALQLITDFINQNSQIKSVSQDKIAEIKFRMQYYAHQVNALETEKAQVEADLEQFTHRYIIELNPQILQILELKKKIYNKLKEYGIEDSTYEDLEKEFNKAQEELTKEEENKIPDLSNDDRKTIKQLHREGVTMCHPDSPNCIYENNAEANGIFDQLTKAYKANDIDRVKMLVQDMKLGKKIDTDNDYDELELMKAKLTHIEQKYKLLLSELVEIKSSKYYQEMPEREDWDEYFSNAQKQLNEEYNELKIKFTHPNIKK